MSLEWFVLVAYVFLALAIGGLYELNKPSVDGRKKQEKTVSSFGYFYLYLYISTPIILVLSIFQLDPSSLGFSTPLAILGLICSTCGTLLFAVAKRQIGKEFSPCHEAFIPKDIICEGVYAYVRHPIYTAMLLFFIGISLTSLHWLAWVNLSILFTYYLRSVELEEKALIENFNKYSLYQTKTGKFFPKLFSSYEQDSHDSNKIDNKAS